MAIRYAAAAGVAAAVVAVGAFLLIPDHKVAGTNGIARLGPVIPVHAGKRYCTQVPGVPKGSGYVRLGVVNAEPSDALEGRRDFSRFPSIPGVGVSIRDARGAVAGGTASDAGSGTVDVRLGHATRAAGPSRLCVSNLGPTVLTFYGEGKRGPNGRVGPALAVTFLDSASTSWLSHPGVILGRFRDGHAGAIGAWALWLATAFALGASFLAFGLMLRESRRA
jgi:hypothetical protein